MILTSNLKTNLFCLNAEQYILGCLLNNYTLWNKVSSVLNEEDFFFLNHKNIFMIIIDFIIFNRSLDISILSNKIKSLIFINDVKIINYLKILKIKNIECNNVYNYALIIHNLSILRKLIYSANNIIKQIILNDEKNIKLLLKNFENDIFYLNKDYNNNFGSNIFNIGSVFDKVVRNIKLMKLNKFIISGVSTGFLNLDKILSGLHKGELIIIAGRPSMGKTAFAINIAQNISINLNLPVIIFSMEMSSEQLVIRILSSISKIKQHNIKLGQLSFDEISKLRIVIDKLYSAKIFIDESVNLTSSDVFHKSKKVLDQYGELGLIVIDYLQLMSSENLNKNRVMEISEISRTLKCLSKNLNVPIIAISQLNRSLENRNNKRPVMSDLRESGAIEQDADVILFIYRDEVYNLLTSNKGITEILISKQRNGPTGFVKLLFFPDILRFISYD